MMKKNSFLINTSRGGIVDEQALAQELKSESGNIIAAAIDVFEFEKSAYTSPLIGLSNVLLTPHIAGTTNEALESSSDMILHNIISILDGCFDVPIVNPEIITSKATSFSK